MTAFSATNCSQDQRGPSGNIDIADTPIPRCSSGEQLRRHIDRKRKTGNGTCCGARSCLTCACRAFEMRASENRRILVCGVTGAARRNWQRNRERSFAAFRTGARLRRWNNRSAMLFGFVNAGSHTDFRQTGFELHSLFMPRMATVKIISTGSFRRGRQHKAQHQHHQTGRR